MPGTITRVVHRHNDQKPKDADLVLEVGRPLPPFYQVGRPRGLSVKSITGDDPVVCKLDDGDVIYIGKRSVRAVTREAQDA